MIGVSALPPKEALAYWQQRVPITADEFSSLEASAQKRAFTVSGATQRELVSAVHESLHEAIKNGTSLQEWRKQAHAILSADSGSPASVLRPHRLDTIYRTNLQTAFQAGRWTQQQAVAEDRPYMRYSAVRDRRTRPEHAALHGMVYPAGHEFWDQYYPPNGFNCRCTVVSLSERDVERKGLEVRKDMPGPQEWANPDTGEVRRVLPAPDPGFGRNAGKDWLAGLSPSELDGELTPVSIGPLCKNGRGLFADEGCKVPLKDIDARHIHEVKPEDLLPKSLSKQEHVAAFLKEFGLTSLDGSALVRLPGNFPLVVDKWLFMDKATGEWKSTWSDKGPYMRLLARTIQNPYEVWWQPVEIGPQKRLVYSLRLIRLFRNVGDKRLGGFGSFSLLGNRWHGATVFSPKAGRSTKAVEDYLEKERRGVLLYRETLE